MFQLEVVGYTDQQICEGFILRKLRNAQETIAETAG